MLSQSSRLVQRTQKLFHISKCFNHVESKTVNPKEKLMQLSSTAVGKYNEIIGFDEIDRAYKKVTTLQEELAKTQNERTNLQLQINHIRQEISNYQTQIQDCKRGEPKYIELMKREFEIIQKKNALEEKFDIIDQKERELFGHLQAKINILHEQSRTHTRQWGIISTIIGALLGIIGTSISAYYRNNDIRRMQQNFQAQFQEQIAQITKDTQKIMDGYSDMMKYLQQYEITGKKKEQINETKQDKNKESWASYLGRKTIAVWKWCTFQKSS